RHNLHTRCRSLGREIPPRVHRRGMRLPRLRQRWLDGHLSRQQRTVRFFHAVTVAAQRALSEQPRWHIYRCDRQGRSARWRLRNWSCSSRRNADRFPDMYVTQYGRSILYRNNGDGTFSDVTEKAGVAARGWASSAVWFDYDNDGKLDLFVCRFV